MSTARTDCAPQNSIGENEIKKDGGNICNYCNNFGTKNTFP